MSRPTLSKVIYLQQLGRGTRKDLNQVAFVPALWKRLTEEDKDELLDICERQIDRYYETRLNLNE